jgi:transposase
MATPRTPLAEIDGNKTARVEHSPYVRGQIIGLRDAGLKWSDIERKLHVPISTCYDIYSRKDLTSDGRSAPRSGRPRLWSKRDERKVVRIARLKLFLTYTQLKFEASVTFSHSTIRRILDVYNISKWRAKKRPKLMEEHACLRLAWAHNHLD